MSTINHGVLLIGDAGAGKTTFLARVWMQMGQNQTALKCNGDPDDVEYAHKISEALRIGNFPDHTPHDSEDSCKFPVKYHDGQGDCVGELLVPDRSGERWKELYKNREWSEFDEHIHARTGCLFFLMTDADDRVPILDCIKLGELASSEELGFKDKIPDEVVCVDWIQCVGTLFKAKLGNAFRPRIAIMLSGWDRVPQEQLLGDPESFFSENFPMLSQFVAANKDDFEFQIFGVSPVGGDLNEPEFQAQFLKNPLQHGYVIRKSAQQAEQLTDLSLPIIWAMGA